MSPTMCCVVRNVSTARASQHDWRRQRRGRLYKRGCTQQHGSAGGRRERDGGRGRACVRAVAPCTLIGTLNVYEVYLTMLSGTRYVWRRMEGWSVNSECCDVFTGMSYIGVSLKGLNKTRNTSISVSGVRPVKGRTS